MMTFEEFQASRFMSLDLAAATEQDMGTSDTVAGYVYCGALFIQRVGEDQWHLVIGNSTRVSGDLEAFERDLYDWALSEGYDVMSPKDQSDAEVEMLTREYAAWNARNGLTLGSADEYLFDESLTQEQRDWVKGFVQRWEDSSLVYSAAGAGPGRHVR